MRGSMFMGSRGSAAANAHYGESLPPLTIVELASIICTGPKGVFWAASAAERSKVQWKGLPVQRKAPRVQRKAARGAMESCSSQSPWRFLRYRIDCSLRANGFARSCR